MSCLSDWWHFEKLKRRRREIRKEFAEQFEKLRKDKSKTSEDYNALQAEEYYEGKAMDEVVDTFLSDRLIEQATECDVEVPPYSENKELFQHTEDGERVYLNAKGRALMRDLIHKEQERNFEKWARWAKTFAPLIAAIAGLLGVLTGLVSVLKK
jgi:hypothetical protein